MSTKFNFKLSEYTKAEEELLQARLKAIRASISHPGEKGRSVEAGVLSIVRGAVPKRFGLATGFIAFHDKACVVENKLEGDADSEAFIYEYNPSLDTIEVSSQLDIIVYDAMRFCPIVDLESSVVLPIESVVAYIEVKTAISMADNPKNGESIAYLLSQSRSIRLSDARVLMISSPGSQIKAAIVPFPFRAIPHVRSFVVALDLRDGPSNPSAVA